MTSIFPSFGNTKHIVDAIGDDIIIDEVTTVVTSATVGGVGVVTVTWPSFQCVLGQQNYIVPAGHIDVNSVDVATPTTYYVYFTPIVGVVTAVATTTNPITDPTDPEFALTNVIRFKSVATVVTIYISKYPTQNGVYELAHNVKEDSLFTPPAWISGIAPTWAAGGKLSTSSGYVRFPSNEPRAQVAVTNGLMLLGDESGTIAGLNNITTYSDGSPVTAGKYIKVLVGISRNKGAILTAPYMVMLQGKPGVEYATQAAAKADAESKAANGFGIDYHAAVTPLGYYVMLLGDYTTGELIDLRVSGLTAGGGGSSGITDHSLLSNLNVVGDHQLYLDLAGTRALTGNWAAGAKNITTTGTVSGNQVASTVAIGTQPLVITSTTKVDNLNADAVDGIQGASLMNLDGSTPLTGNWTAAKDITTVGALGGATVTATGLAKALTFESTQATGTAPIKVASTTKIDNLNADAVDGIQGANLVTADGLTGLTGDWSAGKKITAPNFESTIATGTAPFTVASTTVVANLNASTVQGNAASAFAVAAKGVTNGDTHDHVGGDGAQIAHSGLSGLAADDHTQYLLADGTRALSGNWNAGTKSITTTSSLSGSTLVSTVATGTAPLTVSSTTQVANLNAATLNGVADTGFLKADGSVQLSGNMSVAGAVTIDGVDISAHAGNANAHHNTVTLSVAADTVLQLSTQDIDLDTQTANYIFAGPTSGAVAKPTFRAVVPADIDIARTQGTLTLAAGQNDNVALTAGVDEYVCTGMGNAAFGISGFTGGYGGRTITILNDTNAKNMTAYHQSTSTAANQIWCSGTLADTATTGYGVMVFTYFATKQRWVLVSVIV